MFKKIKFKYLKFLFLAIVGALFLGIIFFLSVYFGAWGKIPGKKELSSLEYQRATEVYTADSVLIGKYYLFDRQPITYEDFPKHLTDALIAIEDERFYEHSGIDYKSLLRVAFKSILMQDQSAGGGSTLTQQLAKNLYPRSNRKKSNLAVHKIKEMIMASRLENSYSKEEIITNYLNTVSFGDNTFGIESASLKFFNKKTKQLNIEEAAVLVGMLKATYGYNPRVFPENSLNRRNLVLQSMHKNDVLTASELERLLELPIKLDYQNFGYSEGIAPYFREEVRKQLLAWTAVQNEKENNYNIYTSGLKIYTTLDYKMQLYAEQAMTEHMSVLQKNFEKSYGNKAPWFTDKNLIKKLTQRTLAYKKLKKSGLTEAQIMDSLHIKKKMTLTNWEKDMVMNVSTIDSLQHYMKFLNTGSIAIEGATGAVKTWIGGVNFKYFKYDHVSQSKRQVGSTFKPIVYTAALENGISPCSYFSAEEVAYKNLKGWSPSNSGNKEEAYLNYSMEEALSNSINTVAVKVLEKTGIKNVLEQAKKMGITAELPEQPSLALGTGEIKITELAGAYASYINEGTPVKPFVISSITNQKDSVLAIFTPEVEGKRAFSKENGQIMIEMMKATIDDGTASRLRSRYHLKNEIAGKTGTTQNNKDAWFTAITPKLIHMSWVGLDNHEIGFNSTALGQGANAALPLFALWMQKLNADKNFKKYTNASFPKPSTEVLELMDCKAVKKDGFLKRLFKNPNKKKIKKFKS